MDVLQKIFAGGDPQQQYQQAQSGQYQDISHQDAVNAYQNAVQQAPPEVVEQAHEQAFSQLPMQQRQQVVQQFQQAANDPQQPFNYGFSGGPQDYDPRNVGRMVTQAQQQQPDLLQQVLGPGGVLSNPMAKAALVGVAAIAAQRLMGGAVGGNRNLGATM